MFYLAMRAMKEEIRYDKELLNINILASKIIEYWRRA